MKAQLLTPALHLLSVEHSGKTGYVEIYWVQGQGEWKSRTHLAIPRNLASIPVKTWNTKTRREMARSDDGEEMVTLVETAIERLKTRLDRKSTPTPTPRPAMPVMMRARDLIKPDAQAG